jgi:allantoin racemase
VTAQVLTECQHVQGQTIWDGVTARLGAPYIASEVAYALAAHAVLDAYALHYSGHVAVLVACFGDPGVLALREICPVPVIGLAHESLLVAAQQGKFAVVTGGKAWGPMLQRFARANQLDRQLVGIHTVELTGAQIAEAPDSAMASLVSAGQAAADEGAQCIVLGGAALTGPSRQTASAAEPARIRQRSSGRCGSGPRGASSHATPPRASASAGAYGFNP